MKKKIKSETRNSAVNDVDPSHLTSHISHSLVTFFNHISHSLSHSFIHIACIVLLIIIIYSNTLNAPFQWDESTFIVDNPIIKNLHYFASPSDAKGLSLYSALINRYVGYLTFALNYRIHGLSVTGYHIVNIAIHIANSVLVYLFVLLTFRTPYFKAVNGEEGVPSSRFTFHVSQSFSDSRSSIAFFSAAIFAVHPLQTEAVTYVFQRFASLVTFLYLLSLVAYIKARLNLTTESTEESSDLKKSKKSLWSLWLILSFLSAVLAMKTKENAFTLPFVIVLYEFCFFSRSSRLTIHDSRPFSRFLFLVPLLLTLTIIPLTLMGLSGTHQLDPGEYGTTVFLQKEYLFTQFRVVVTYLRLLFFPVDQNIVYDYPVFKTFFDPNVMLSFAFLAAFFAAGVYLLFTRRNAERSTLNAVRLVGFGILWFFITLSVESSIIPLPMLIDEYRMYLPSIGLIICVVTGAFLLFSRFTFHDSRFTAFKTVVFLVLIIGVLSVATYLRNGLWGDEIRLWEDTARKSPANAKAHINLGAAYEASGVFDKAMEQHLIAVKLNPYDAAAHFNLGYLYYRMGQIENARREVSAGLQIKPDDQQALQLLRLLSP